MCYLGVEGTLRDVLDYCDFLSPIDIQGICQRSQLRLRTKPYQELMKEHHYLGSLLHRD